MSRRLLALIIVAAVAVAAVALDRSAPEVVTPAVAAHPVDGPVIPPPDAASVAWYCAEGTSTLNGRADETIIVGNLAKEPITATITVMRGQLPPASLTVRVDALAQRRVKVADVLATEEPGVIVEVFGGPAIVEHELRGRDDVAVGPCTREPSKHWYFGAGDTTRGGEEWLALFNPYGDDAIVDVTFLTDTGVQQPEDAQGFVVPRHSRVSMAVHDLVRRQERVAIGVTARTGRVVAERSLRYDGSEGITGLAVSLGVTGRANQWYLPFGESQDGVTRSLALANFGDRSAAVEVATPLDGKNTLEPRTVDVPARSVVHVDTNETVPVGTGYWVSVRVTRGPPVVAEGFGTWGAPSDIVGVATAPASTAGARRWAFTIGRLDGAGQALLSAVNVSGRPLTVQVYAYTAGDPNSPRSAPAEAVPPGERAVFGLRERGIRPNQVIVVAADGAIVAGRDIEDGGASLSTGIPDRG